MSEFVECQSCGRSFFAENLDCPYCSTDLDEDTETLVADLMRTVAPSTPAPPPRPASSALYGVLFSGFAVLAAGIAVAALVGFARARTMSERAWLLFEAAFALVTIVGVVSRRRWGRVAAITFTAYGIALGVWTLVASDRIQVWGFGPFVLLLFVWPFLGAAARDRFTR